MPKNWKKWTREEIKYLRENYFESPKFELMKFLNRTWPSIQKETFRLSLRRTRFRKPWSKEETNFLRSNFENLSVKKIAEKLHRPRKGVHEKMVELNLPVPSIRRFLHPHMTETEKAYIAGFLDGEGWITFHPHWHKGRLWGCSPQIGFANTNRKPLDFIAKVLSEDSSRDFEKIIKMRKEKSPHKREIWEIRLEGKFAIFFFLKTIQPYLLVKQKHAEIMIKLLGLRKTGTRWTKDQLKLLLQLCELQGIHHPTRLRKYLISHQSDWRIDLPSESSISPSK